MTAGKRKGFVQRPDTNATLQHAPKVVYMALQRIDKLETRQFILSHRPSGKGTHPGRLERGCLSTVGHLGLRDRIKEIPV